MDRSRHVVGIDIGGTATRFVCIDSSGNAAVKAVFPTPSQLDGAEVPSFLLQGIDHVLRGREPAAVGIGASGPIDPQGIIRNPDTLPAFTGVELTKPIADRFQVSCLIDNDAAAAAYGESRLGASAGYRSALMVTLGTGVGVSMIQNGVAVRGADGVHPESGHMSVGPIWGPAPCYCGKAICWEQQASRTALQSRSSELLNNAANPIDNIGLAYAAAQAGNAKARNLFDQYGLAIAQGLANLLTIYRPPCVVIGGAGAQYFDVFSDSLRAALAKEVGLFPGFSLVPATLGDFGGAIGAALLADSNDPPA